MPSIGANVTDVTDVWCRTRITAKNRSRLVELACAEQPTTGAIKVVGIIDRADGLSQRVKRDLDGPVLARVATVMLVAWDPCRCTQLPFSSCAKIWQALAFVHVAITLMLSCT